MKWERNGTIHASCVTNKFKSESEAERMRFKNFSEVSASGAKPGMLPRCRNSMIA